MSGFEIPDWAMPQPVDAPPPPPLDPATLREQRIADNTRAEEGLNQFLAAKQAALFEAPNAFYRTQGSDAIHAAPVILDRLSRLRDDSLDGLANDAQRDRLAPALDAHMDLARDDIGRHVAEQSLEWQRKVAQDRIALLTKEAAYHQNDDARLAAIGQAADSAARAHARVGDGLDQQAEDAAAALARSSIMSAAIKARFDRGNAAAALPGQIQQASQAEGETPASAEPDVQTDTAASDVQTAQSIWPFFGKPPFYVPEPSRLPETPRGPGVPALRQGELGGRTCRQW